MKYNRIFLFIILSFFLLSCNNKKEEYSTDAPNRGEITIHYDDSFSNVAEALTYRYMKFYPETKINLQISKEDKALEDLLNHKVRLIIMSRELTETERRLYDSKIKLKWQPAYFAADAVCFVVNKNSSLSSVSLAEIKQMLSSKERKLIFDGSNTSNLNAIVQKLQLDPKKIEYSVIKGNENITDLLDANQFRWTKTNADGSPDLVWNAMHAGGTKSIIIETDDVNKRATFSCDIIEEI